MTKVAIKNENITSFGGIYHIMDVFSKLGFERHGWQATDRSENDFRHARKRQTFRETTFAMRGNAKPFGKRLSPCAEMPNLLRSDLREPRKRQTLFRMSKCYKIMLFLKYYRELFIFHLSPASTNTQMYNLFGLK